MRAQGFYAVALCRVVPRRDIGHAGFARKMRRLLGNFTADIQISACRNGFFEVALRTAGTPRDPTYDTRRIAHHQRFALQNGFNPDQYFSRAFITAGQTNKADLLVAKSPCAGPTKLCCELNVVGCVWTRFADFAGAALRFPFGL